MHTSDSHRLAHRVCLILLLALMCPALTAQTIYRSKDARGNPVFSDQPPTGAAAEQLQLTPTNRYEAPPPSISAPAVTVSEDEAAETAVDYRVSIRSPANDSTVPMGPGNFTISADVQPALEPAHGLLLLFNGNPMQQAQQQTTWSLQNVPRGEHDFAVAVVRADGTELARSAAVRINVLRPSLLYPNRQ